MHLFWRMRSGSAKFQSFIRGGFSDTRTQLTFLGKVFFCQTSFADSGVNGSFGSKVVAPTVLEAEKEEAKKTGVNGSLGMDHDQIKDVTHRNPPFFYYSMEETIKPLVEFLLDLGVSKSDIPAIFSRSPHLCRSSLSENIIPAMALLESLGVEKKKWAKLIKVFPFVLLYSRQKVKITVNFLYEMGLSAESIGKILTKFPQIIGCSVEDKLRPTAKYFNSLGVDVAVLLQRAPQNFGLSMEANLKPVTEFFLGRGYSMEEVGTMISRFGNLYTLSLVKNLIPKWEFFLTLDYPRSELVKHPAYFGYSLEKRIKPRYALMRECGVVLPLSTLLSLSSDVFDTVLESRLKKKLAD